MIRFIFSAVMLFMSHMLFSQEHPMQPRPSVYDQSDEVRKELKLDQKQFSKVYSAYEKFEKAVFGDSGSRNSGFGRPSGEDHGKGGPGGGAHGGPGMGRPGGGGHGGPGMGGPGGGRHGGPGMGAQGDRPPHDGMSGSNNRKQLPPDLEKLEKTKSKQEEKLDKSMKKLFKKNNELYEKWKTLREAQLKKLFPPFRPTPQEHDPTK